jgi:ABC-type multidrug transport system ATPase subunit
VLDKGVIKFKDFNGYWKEEFETAGLKSISFTFEPGHIYGITGRVGSGKSGLIGAMLH